MPRRQRLLRRQNSSTDCDRPLGVARERQKTDCGSEAPKPVEYQSTTEKRGPAPLLISHQAVFFTAWKAREHVYLNHERLPLKHLTVCVRAEAGDERRIPEGGSPEERGIVPGSERKKAARKRAKRAPVTTGNHVPERAADPAKQSSRHLRPRTAEDIANEQTAEQLALRIWAAMVAQKVLSSMSALMDELIQSHLLDDDDEEVMKAGSMITASARRRF